MRFLHHIVTTKGFLHGIERAVQVLGRFAFGGRRFDRRMDLFLDDLDRTGNRATFFVAACCIERHAGRIRRLRERGHEIASHGLYHSRMDLFDKRGQLDILEQSHRRLLKAGIDAKGFRAPYLNFDDATGMALIESPFAWTSQEIIFWDHGILDRRAIQRLKGLYHFASSDDRLSLPVLQGRLTEVPIVAPDDEMLIERCRIVEPERLYRIWQMVFDLVSGAGELFHLLIHPERYPICRQAAARLMAYRSERGGLVWRATLGEVAEWWRDRSRWRCEFDAHEVRVEAPEGCWFSDAEPWLKSHDGSQWRFRADVPRLRLAPEASEELERFLRLEGFMVERTVNSDGPGILLPERELQPGGERALVARLKGAGPRLPRLERWPHPYTGAACISADICAIDIRDFLERARHF